VALVTLDVTSVQFADCQPTALMVWKKMPPHNRDAGDTAGWVVPSRLGQIVLIASMRGWRKANVQALKPNLFGMSARTRDASSGL
jgi:hypothetical protein